VQYSSHTLFTSSSSSSLSGARPTPAPQRYVLLQARHLSLWGSQPKPPAPVTPATPQADLTIQEPSDFDRTIRASDNVAADASFQSHAPNPLEPQIVENAQQSLLEPHVSGADAAALPNFEDVPERLGYLKEVCGLDFGWGPTAIMEWVFEHTHIWAGLSWTTSIVLLGIALRSTMFPFLVGSADQSGRMREMAKEMKPTQDAYKQAARTQDRTRMQQLQLEMRAIKNRHGVQLTKAFYPLLIQVPFGFGAWRLLRNCATLPVPGFITESWLWTSDLTFSDPYFIMPALSSLMIYTTLRMNASANQGTATVGGPDAMAILRKIMPVLSFAFVSFQPGAVQLYFVSSAATGLGTAWLLQNRAVRGYLKLPVLEKHKPLPGDPASTSTGASAPSALAASTEFMRTKSFGQGKSRAQVLEEQARAVEEQEAKAAQENRSGVDKAVDSVKGQWTDIKKHGSSIFKSVAGTMEEQVATKKRKQREEYDARVRAELEEQREARNRELGIQETKREGGMRRR